MVNLRLSFFEVLNSNFHIVNVLFQLSVKITMRYRKTLFLCILKYFLIQNSSFQENAKTKVYALEDFFGVFIKDISVSRPKQLCFILLHAGGSDFRLYDVSYLKTYLRA